jgi:hypothetical protein
VDGATESERFLKKLPGLNPAVRAGVLLLEPRIFRVRFRRGVLVVKKKLGFAALPLLALVISAGCASSGAPPQPPALAPDSGQTWAKAAPASQLSSRPAKPAAIRTEGK